jgi:hypothetical protein
VLEVFTARGLPASLYTDRSSHFSSRRRPAMRACMDAGLLKGEAFAVDLVPFAAGSQS